MSGLHQAQMCDDVLRIPHRVQKNTAEPHTFGSQDYNCQVPLRRLRMLHELHERSGLFCFLSRSSIRIDVKGGMTRSACVQMQEPMLAQKSWLQDTRTFPLPVELTLILGFLFTTSISRKNGKRQAMRCLLSHFHRHFSAFLTAAEDNFPTTKHANSSTSVSISNRETSPRERRRT